MIEESALPTGEMDQAVAFMSLHHPVIESISYDSFSLPCAALAITPLDINYEAAECQMYKPEATDGSFRPTP